MKNFLENFNNSVVELSFNENFEVENADMGQPSGILSDFINSNAFNDIYSNFDGLELIWKNNKNQQYGSAKIQSQSDFIEDGWEDMVTDVEKITNCDIEQFRVFDFYASQNYVGCFLNNYNEVGLFYVRDLTAYPLNITASSYLKLMTKTFGLIHWPSLLVKFNLDIDLLESKGVEANLIDTFESFNMKEFKKEYLNLKIK